MNSSYQHIRQTEKGQEFKVSSESSLKRVIEYLPPEFNARGINFPNDRSIVMTDLLKE